MTTDFTPGTVEIKGQRVEARADHTGAVAYVTSSGKWRAASAKAAASFAPVEAKPVKVCKKDPTHGEHRITKSGSYCYACDRIVAERQKAERAAAKAAAK
jgi:hypothetical protein